MWVLLDMFQIINSIYSMLLVVYYSKLSELEENKTFTEVKRWINRLELVLFMIASIFILITAIVSIIPHLVHFAYD